MSQLESGSVVWVRLGQAWWPGSITTVAKCPPDFVQGLKKPPIAIVKFFHENEFQDVHKSEHILPYNCDRKEEFIKKGQSVNKNQSHGDVDLLAKFESDVVTAEKLTGGDMNILQTLQEEVAGKRRIDYSDLGFGASKAKRKRGEEGTPRQGSDIGQAVVYKKVGKGGVGKVVIQHKVRIMEQPHREGLDEDMQGASGWFKCSTCGFTCTRLNVMVWHNKAHLKKVCDYDSGIKIPGRRRRRGGGSGRGRTPKRKSKGGKGRENIDHAHTNGEMQDGQKDTEQILMDWDDDDDGGGERSEQHARSDDDYSDEDAEYPPSPPKYERQPMPKPADINSAFDALLAATPTTTTNTTPGPGHTFAKNDSDSDYSDWEKYYARDSESGTEDEVEQESDIKSLCESKDAEKNHVQESKDAEKNHVQEEKKEEKVITEEVNNESKEEDKAAEGDDKDKSAPSTEGEVQVTTESDGHFEREEHNPNIEDEDDKITNREEVVEPDEKSGSRTGAVDREAEEGVWEPSDDNSDLVEYMEEPEERTPHMSPADVEEEVQTEETTVENEEGKKDAGTDETYPDSAVEVNVPETQEEPVNLASTRPRRSPVQFTESENQCDGETGGVGSASVEKPDAYDYQEPVQSDTEEDEVVRVQLGEDGAEIIDADEESIQEAPVKHQESDKRHQEPAPRTAISPPQTKTETSGDSTSTTYMLVAVDAHGNTVPTVPTPALGSDGSNLMAVEATMEDGTSRTLYIDPAQLGPNVDLNNLVLHIDTSGQEHVIIPPSSTQDPANTPDTPKHQRQDSQDSSSHQKARHHPSDHSDGSKYKSVEPEDLRQQVRTEEHSGSSSPRQYPEKHYRQEINRREYRERSPKEYEEESADSREYQEQGDSMDYQEEPQPRKSDRRNSREYSDDPSDSRDYQEDCTDSREYEEHPHASRKYIKEPTSRKYPQEHPDSKYYQDETSDSRDYPEEPERELAVRSQDSREFPEGSQDAREYQEQSSDSRQYSEDPSDSRDYQEDAPEREYQEASDSRDYREEVPEAEYHEEYQQEPSDLSSYQEEPSDLTQYRRGSPERNYQQEQSPKHYEEGDSERQYQDEPSDERQYEGKPPDGRQSENEPSDARPYKNKPSNERQYEDEPSDERQYQDEPSDLRRYQSETMEHKPYSTPHYGERSNSPLDYHSSTRPDYRSISSSSPDSYSPHTYHSSVHGNYSASPAHSDYRMSSSHPDTYHSPNPHT